MKRCPKCAALAANDAWLCECGFEFVGNEPEVLPDPAKPSMREGWRTGTAALLAFLPVRSRLAWLVLPVVCYLLSFLWLDIGLKGHLLYFPVILLNAPLGLLRIFDKSFGQSDSRALGACFVVHVIFWTLFAFGFGGARSSKVPLSFLRALYIVILLLLVCTMYGCARYFHVRGADIN